MNQTAEGNTMNTAIDESADLNFAFLIAEGEDGAYEPVEIVSTMREAREIAEQNLRIRRSEMEKGRDVMCPTRYVVWKRGARGTHSIVQAFDAD